MSVVNTREQRPNGTYCISQNNHGQLHLLQPKAEVHSLKLNIRSIFVFYFLDYLQLQCHYKPQIVGRLLYLDVMGY